MLVAGPAAAVEPFVLKDIRVEGLQRTDPGTVFASLPFRIGDTYNDEKGAAALRALFATGLFKDVRIDIDNGVAIVIVEERPVVAAIDFVGLKEFDKDTLIKSLKDFGIGEGLPFDKALADRAEQELKRQYLTRSLYGAEVVTTVTPIERNRVNVTFTVNEGSASRIREIRIVGNHAFSEGTLKALFDLNEGGWFSWYTKSDRYSRAKLNADLETLRSFYLNRGYLEFNVESTQVTISPDKQDISITVNVKEGQTYIVTGVNLEGEYLGREDEFKSLVTIKPGEPYRADVVAETTRAFVERFGTFGYAFAKVDARPEIDRANGQVVLTLVADPQRRVYVRRINVAGNTKTRDEVIRRELRQLEGAFYDGQRLQESKKRVERLGYFEPGVELETEPVTGTTDQVDVTLKVKEKPTGAVLFGLGFSSSDKLIVQGSVTQANIFGSGKAITLSANTSHVNRNIGLSYTNPYFTVDGVSAGFSVYDRKFDAQALGIGNYTTGTLGGGVSFGYPITDLDRINMGLAIEQTKIELFDGAPQRFVTFVAQNGSDPVGLPMTLGWVRDRRDSALLPTTGTIQRLFGEIALPGFDLKYYKVTYDATWYFPITRDIGTALRGLLGWGGGYGGGSLPFFKAYYAGGTNSVRGYQQGTLGPQDANGVLGGSRSVLGSAEILAPFPGMGQDKSLRVGWFVDAGQVWLNQPGLSLGDTTTFINSNGEIQTLDLSLRYSTGVIFAWASPFGPLRAFYSFPLNEKPGDRLQKFQFIFGQQF
jgi:outer membrane protein insertion porin family